MQCEQNDPLLLQHLLRLPLLQLQMLPLVSMAAVILPLAENGSSETLIGWDMWTRNGGHWRGYIRRSVDSGHTHTHIQLTNELKLTAKTVPWETHDINVNSATKSTVIRRRPLIISSCWWYNNNNSKQAQGSEVEGRFNCWINTPCLLLVLGISLNSKSLFCIPFLRKSLPYIQYRQLHCTH